MSEFNNSYAPLRSFPGIWICISLRYDSHHIPCKWRYFFFSLCMLLQCCRAYVWTINDSSKRIKVANNGMMVILKRRAVNWQCMLTCSTAGHPLAGIAGKNLSAPLAYWVSWANQLESFFLVPLPRSSHCLAMVSYGRGDVEMDVPATWPATSSAWNHITQVHTTRHKYYCIQICQTHRATCHK